MTSLRLQKRLAAQVLKCGKRRIFLDPQASEEVAGASSRRAIRRLVKNRVIFKKPIKGVSRYRWRMYQEAKRRGRHMGLGKRKGTKNARMPFKTLWMRRQRVLRRLLRKFREQKKIDPATYHTFYRRAKGNQFRNKRHLMESIYEANDQQREQRALTEQREARKARAAAKKERKAKAIEEHKEETA